MKAYERLLKYVVVRTPSDENSETVPSSVCQFDLARLLETEMKELGLTDVVLMTSVICMENFRLPQDLKTNRRLDSSHIWILYLIYCDHDIKPIVTENYDGGILTWNKRYCIKCKNFPHLTSLKGRTLITSDGTTVLGADDKAGIAEILTMIERVQEEKFLTDRSA